METGLFDLLVSPNKPSSTISLKNYKAYFVVIVFLLRIKKNLIRRLLVYRFSLNIEQARDCYNYVHNRERFTQLHT